MAVPVRFIDPAQSEYREGESARIAGSMRDGSMPTRQGGECEKFRAAGPFLYVFTQPSAIHISFLSTAYTEILDLGGEFHQLTRPIGRNSICKRVCDGFDLPTCIIQNALFEFERSIEDIGVLGFFAVMSWILSHPCGSRYCQIIHRKLEFLRLCDAPWSQVNQFLPPWADSELWRSDTDLLTSIYISYTYMYQQIIAEKYASN